MRVLFLDDNSARLRWARRELGPGNHLVLTETAEQTVLALADPQGWNLVFLDHDLGGETFVNPDEANTGSAVVRWIVANRPRVDWFVVHSLNAPAANRMVANLRGADCHASYMNFLKLVDRVGQAEGFKLAIDFLNSGTRGCGQ